MTPTPAQPSAADVEAVRAALLRCGYDVSARRVRDVLRLLPHMRAVEAWPGGLVLAKYQNGRLLEVEHKARERVEEEAA